MKKLYETQEKKEKTENIYMKNVKSNFKRISKAIFEFQKKLK